MSQFTHLDESGAASMVDVSDKATTTRIAVATGYLTMQPATLKLIQAGALKKGDVLSVARIAGIMAAKRTHELIPLCHPLLISKIAIEFKFDEDHSRIHVTSTVKISGQTGVEMEALTAVSVACLTMYDMAKAVDKDMRIEGIRLLTKTGGKSGDYKAKD
jgi:cyclic pyranopterin monophosphate synthase